MGGIQNNLKRTVYFLSGEVGPRSHRRTDALNKAADYIKSEFRSITGQVMSLRSSIMSVWQR
ncbi:MAG: hypothetical protein C4560_11470 [Nitrospiraceae bacterium]|nr:MAG: hypothetical protein C4560_11470 [Nitrospiraceae bacterium]